MYSHISASNVKFSVPSGPLPVPNFTFIGQCVAPARRKTYFWTTE